MLHMTIIDIWKPHNYIFEISLDFLEQFSAIYTWFICYMSGLNGSLSSVILVSPITQGDILSQMKTRLLPSYHNSLLLTFVPQSDQTQPTFALPVSVSQADRSLQTAEPAPLPSGERHCCDTPTGSAPTAPHWRIRQQQTHGHKQLREYERLLN